MCLPSVAVRLSAAAWCARVSVTVRRIRGDTGAGAVRALRRPQRRPAVLIGH